MKRQSPVRIPTSPSTPLRLERLEDRNLLSGATTTFDDLAVDTSHYDAHNIIVALQPGYSAAKLFAVNPLIADSGSADNLGNGLFELTLNDGVSVAQGLAYFQAQSWVRYAQPDYTVSLMRTPGDTSFTSQWGLNNTGQSSGTADADIDAPEAWNTATGSGNVIVAVIDTGVDYTHPDLAANMWRNSREVAGNGRDDDGNGFIDDIYGWDFANSDSNPMDDNGHGTHCAGIIGAVGDNGAGVAGVNWRVKIMALKFLDSSGSGSLSNAIRALNYAVANGAKVSNNSYGGGGFYQAFNDSVAAAGRAGHIFVAAAGNDAQNTDNSPQYPADYNLDNIISVAATDRNDRLASFSNYGARTVDIAAPGVSIYSTYKNGGYMSMSGTSMATPFVAGAVAMLQDRNPSWTYRQIITQILNTADPISSLQGKVLTGGRLNLAKAVGGNNGGGGPTDTVGANVTSANFAGAASGSFDRLRVTFSEAINASTFTAADVVGLSRNGTAVSGVTFTITPVSGTNNQFDIGFTKQTGTGSYSLTFGPDIRDVAGNQMNSNGNTVNGETGDRFTAVGTLATTRTFYSTDTPKPVYDLSRTTATLTITQSMTIERLAVKVNVAHSYVGDLRVSLKSPAGTTILLFNQRGRSGDNISTTFDDRAGTAIANGAAPYTGWFKPEQALAALAGQNAKGTWTLIVEDVAQYDSGKLNSWGLTIDTGGTGMARKFGDVESAPVAKSGEKFAAILPTTTATAVVDNSQPTTLADRALNFAREIDPQVAIPLQSSALPEVTTSEHESVRLATGHAAMFTEWLNG